MLIDDFIHDKNYSLAKLNEEILDVIVSLTRPFYDWIEIYVF